MTKTIRISRERKELIAKYSTAAVSLYGVISVDEFVDVFNHYEAISTNAEETTLALQRFAKTDRVDYAIHNGILSVFPIFPKYEHYDNNVAIIRAHQREKPRYLPAKEEFLRYCDFEYIEPEKPYAELKAYILKHKLFPESEGIEEEEVEVDLIELRNRIQFGDSNNSYIDYFTEIGYQFKDIDAVNAFLQVLMNAHNNTRMFDNNGFTPEEMIVIFAKKPKSSAKIEWRKPPFKESEDELFAKVKSDDPCPCGSGKEFKNCHGAETPPQNRLSASDAEHFYRLWYGVLAFVNKKYHFSPSVQRDLELNNYKTIDNSKILSARNRVWEKPKLIAESMFSMNEKLSDEDRAILLSWQKNFIKGEFLALKHLKDYTVFMSPDKGKGNTLYGVIGLSNSLERIISRDQLPASVETTLMPFKGRIVHDSLILKYPISYQSGARSAFEKFYEEELAKNGITLEIF